MAVDDIYRVDYFMELDGRTVSVSVHWRESEAILGSELEKAEAVGEATYTAFWAAFWQNHASDELRFVYWRCQKIDPERDVIFQSAFITGQVGEVAEPSLNGTDAVLISEYTNFWGARTRGRIYLPGFPEVSVSEGRIRETPFLAVQAAADLFFTPELEMTSHGSGKLVASVFSRGDEDAVPPIPSTWAGPIRPVVRARIATQRRRRTTNISPAEDLP